ncbi:MAG: hypothetical protein AB7P33_01335 [Dehalococcoidia bacterium]
MKRTTPWVARLALFVLLFQISAIDHHTHVEDVTGIVGSSQHAMHCHGAAGSCVSGATEQPAILTQSDILPSHPTLTLLAVVGDYAIPADAVLSLGTEPPQA